MPVIPFAQQEQVANASNPVPIRSGEVAALGGEAQASFGKAMFNVGNVLDNIANKVKDENSKIAMVSGEAQVQMAILKAKATQQAASILPEDPTGFKAVEEYQKNVSKARDEIVKNADPAIQAKLLAQADKMMADHAPDVLAHEVKKRAGNLEVDTGKMVSDLGSLASMGGPDQPPDMQMWTHSLAMAQLSIQKRTDIPEAAKPEMLRNAKGQIVRQMVDGMATRQHWTTAIAMLNTVTEYNPDGSVKTYGLGDAFDAKEKESLIQKLRSDESSFYTKSNQRLDYEDKQVNKYKKEVEDNKLSEYFVALRTAGSDSAARGPIMAQLDEDVKKGYVTPEKARTLLDPTAFTKERDAQIRSEILGDVISGTTSAKAAVEKIKALRGAPGGMSYQAAASTLVNVQTANVQLSRMGPGAYTLTRDNAKNAAISALTNGMSGKDSVEFSQKLDSIHSTMTDLLVKDPNLDHAAAAAQALRVTFPDKVPNLAPGTTPEAIQKQRQDLAAKAQGSQLSMEQQREMIEEDKKLKFAQGLLLLDRESQHHQSRRAVAPIGGK